MANDKITYSYISVIKIRYQCMLTEKVSEIFVFVFLVKNKKNKSFFFDGMNI